MHFLLGFGVLSKIAASSEVGIRCGVHFLQCNADVAVGRGLKNFLRKGELELQELQAL